MVYRFLSILCVIVGVFFLSLPLIYWVRNPELTQMQILFETYHYTVLAFGMNLLHIIFRAAGKDD